ncbi:hypothetical protein GQ53DRAFT_648698 [Thozetella sp. PMI_491]|nr:hypothetical protein GQ53DRAFT_648698 [Thozetella sp. PMI_491]
MRETLILIFEAPTTNIVRTAPWKRSSLCHSSVETLPFTKSQRAKRAMDGYKRVAELMAAHDEFAILRRFRSLNMQNLLYRQAEIIHLEERLLELAARDSQHPDRPYHGRDWWSLANGLEQEDCEQWEAIAVLRQKLEDYNDSVLKQAQMSRLNDPSNQDLEFLRSWLVRPQMGAFPLLGLDRSAWDVTNDKDLLAIRSRDVPDAFSQWVLRSATEMSLANMRFKNHAPIGPGIYSYDERYLAAVFYGFATVLASILPISSVVVLYFVQSNNVRLGLTVLFCLIFSLLLVLVTNAKKVEVFAATAA